jgi:CRISPR/Cas system-associated exonuclease Cas4 (RecB family)
VPSAREVEQYAYCAHNWLLARQGVDPHGPSARSGLEQHKGLGGAQTAVEADKKDYRLAMGTTFQVLGLAGSATFLTLELLFLRATEQHIILLATALVLVAASAGLLVLALLAQRRYKGGQERAGIVPGRLLASDLSGSGPLLVDKEWGISGRPDYVLQTANGVVPVEVKTGKTPDRPHRSHAMQLACYMRLIESSTGTPPPYGLLTYPEGAFRLDWDRTTQDQLRGVLGGIKQAEASGKADRDHQVPGRCIGCARREACDQRLA